MGTNILSWSCQGIRPKLKELELYLKENIIDVIALNETFLSKKHNFKIPGYDTVRNDSSTSLAPRPTSGSGDSLFCVAIK